MTNKNTAYLFIFNMLCISWCNGAQDELVAVVVIYRHGDRTPIQPYPTDPYKNRSYWPVDFGQLTNTGKKQHFELGRWLRNRYDQFLPDTYSENDIYVRSTDVDRTLMSAAADLAGLYPPVHQEIWNKDLKWQPIPIHTVPQLNDPLLAAKKPCPKYDLLFKQLLKSDYFQNISHKNHDLYAYLTRYSGETVSSLEALEYLYNTFLIETLYNYTLPEWASKVFPKKLEPWAFLSFATATYTRDLARLKIGPLLNHIIDFFQNKTQKHSATPRFLMMSGHDTTIANVLNSLGVFEYHSPPYTATIIFELRRRLNGVNYVRMFYKNTTEARPMTVHNCDSDCDLIDFITILKPLRLSLPQWEQECKVKWMYNYWPFDFVGWLILASIVFGIVLITLGVVMGLKRTKTEESNNYMQLPNEEYA